MGDAVHTSRMLHPERGAVGKRVTPVRTQNASAYYKNALLVDARENDLTADEELLTADDADLHRFFEGIIGCASGGCVSKLF